MKRNSSSKVETINSQEIRSEKKDCRLCCVKTRELYAITEETREHFYSLTSVHVSVHVYL